MALNFIWADAAIVAGKLLALLITSMNEYSKWIASFNGFVVKNIPFTLLLTLCAYAVVIAVMIWLYKKTFTRLAVLFSAVICFQLVYIATVQKAKNNEELIVFNNWKNSLITIKHGKNITTYSNDSLISENRNLLAYNKGNFNPEVTGKPLTNMLWFKQHKILILDSLGVYDSLIKPDILILTQSPKINIDRLLANLQPKLVIADATNYKSYTARWAATCRKQKIPFHATAEKGFYKIN